MNQELRKKFMKDLKFGRRLKIYSHHTTNDYYVVEVLIPDRLHTLGRLKIETSSNPFVNDLIDNATRNNQSLFLYINYPPKDGSCEITEVDKGYRLDYKEYVPGFDNTPIEWGATYIFDLG